MLQICECTLARNWGDVHAMTVQSTLRLRVCCITAAMAYSWPMCGRFYLDVPKKILVDHFHIENNPNLQPHFNIAPSQDIAAVRETDRGRELAILRWGLIPHWAKEEKTGYSMINARAETVDQKPSFRTAYKRHRCLIPASGFYEWQAGPSGKQPFAIGRKDGEVFAMAGLWELWENPEGRVIESCTIIVTTANEVIKPIHDRMPVILEEDDYETWLDRDTQDPAVLKPLLRQFPAALMKTYPVSRRVNNPKYDDPDCILPV